MSFGFAGAGSHGRAGQENGVRRAVEGSGRLDCRIDGVFAGEECEPQDPHRPTRAAGRGERMSLHVTVCPWPTQQPGSHGIAGRYATLAWVDPAGGLNQTVRNRPASDVPSTSDTRCTV